MTQDRTSELDLPAEERVVTPAGTVCLMYLSTTSARAISGRDVGWMHLDGVPLYGNILLRQAGEDWVIDPVHSVATTVVDGKAGERAPLDVRDAAWNVLRETFMTWRETRPDIAARVHLVACKAEEFRAEDRIASLLAEIERLREELPQLRQARAEAEADVEQSLAEMAPGPRP